MFIQQMSFNLKDNCFYQFWTIYINK